MQQNIERLPPRIEPRRQPHDFNADTSLAVLMSKMELEDEYLPPLERLHIANWMSELPGYPSVKHLMPQVLADVQAGIAEESSESSSTTDSEDCAESTLVAQAL